MFVFVLIKGTTYRAQMAEDHVFSKLSEKKGQYNSILGVTACRLSLWKSFKRVVTTLAQPTIF